MTKGRPLRVCHVAYTFYESDNRVMRYAETLAARGDHVDVIALRHRGQTFKGILNGVNVYRIQRRTIDEKAALGYLLKILWFFAKSFVLLGVMGLRKTYDVVHVHNVPDFLVFTALAPKLFGAGVLLDIHDVQPELYAAKFGAQEHSVLFRCLLLVERACCRFADHVIVANHLWHDRLTRRSVPQSKCTVILNYPDLGLFRPNQSRTREGSDGFRLLYPGTLNHHQGLDLAIAAFAEAHRQMPGAELHIYGDGPAREALRLQTTRLGLTDRVKFADRVPLHQVPQLIASSDVGIVPKRADGFGNEAFSTKILEFMACGVPVIVARTKVDAYYFTEELVRFFAPGDAADLARQMVWVYEHRGDHQAWIRSAQCFAARNSWQVHASAYLDLVERLAASGQEVRHSLNAD